MQQHLPVTSSYTGHAPHDGAGGHEHRKGFVTAFRGELSNRYVVVWSILITVLWWVTPQLAAEQSWSYLFVFTDLLGVVPASIAAAWASATLMAERSTKTMAVHQVLSTRSPRERFAPVFFAHVLLFAIVPMVITIAATILVKPHTTVVTHPETWVYYIIALVFIMTTVALGHQVSGVTNHYVIAGALSFWAVVPFATMHRMPVLALPPYTTVNPWFYAITAGGLVSVFLGAYFSSRLRYERHSPAHASRSRSITVTLLIIAALFFTVAALTQPQTVPVNPTAEQARTSVSTLSTEDINA